MDFQSSFRTMVDEHQAERSKSVARVHGTEGIKYCCYRPNEIGSFSTIGIFFDIYYIAPKSTLVLAYKHLELGAKTAFFRCCFCKHIILLFPFKNFTMDARFLCQTETACSKLSSMKWNEMKRSEMKREKVITWPKLICQRSKCDSIIICNLIFNS